MWNEGMISLTLPGDPLLLPALFSGAARSSPGHPSARRAGGLAVTATRREGGAQRDQRQPISCGGPDSPPNPEAALGRLHAGSGQPLLPTLLSPGAYGTHEDLSPGLPRGRDAPAGPQCRRARDGGAPLPTNPPGSPLFFDPPAPP